MKIGFIVGSGRCGSSFIHEIISRHRKIGFISNVDDNLAALNLSGRYNNFLFRCTPEGWARKGRLRFAPSEAYKLISEKVSPIYVNSCRDLSADDVTPWLERRFREFFQVRFERQCKNLLLHKYTGWSRLGFFSRIFPDARFVNIVRDGRAVANSWLQMPWWGGYRGPENWLWGGLSREYMEEWENSGRSFVVLSGIAWKILMDAFDVGSVEVPSGQYMTVKYEEFVEYPRDTIGKILDFFEVERYREFDKDFGQLRVDVSRTRAYERDLSANQLSALEACLEPKLRDYGYISH